MLTEPAPAAAFTAACSAPQAGGKSESWHFWPLWIAAAAAGLALASAHAALKLPCLVLAAVLMVTWVQRTDVRLQRRDLVPAGLLVFGGAFIASPYWSLSTLPVGAPLSALLVLLLGIVWSRCAAVPVVKPPAGSSGFCGHLLTAALVVVLVAPSLSASLAWRGDEDYHLRRVWALKDAWPASGWAVWFLGVACALALWNPRRTLKPLWRAVVVVAALVTLGVLMARANHDGRLDALLTRYPFMMVWIQAFVTWAALGWEAAVSTDPALVRLTPCLALVLLALWWSTRVHNSGAGRAAPVLVAGLCTVPALLFYSTLNALELPLIALMVWVCCDADRLLSDRLHNRPLGCAWLALAVIPFLKETAVVFCLAVAVSLAVGAALHLHSERRRARELLGILVRCGVVLLLPGALFLWFRAYAPADQRSFIFDPTNFAEPSLYWIFFRALWEQHGLLVILSLAGLSIAWRRRPGLVGFCLLVWCAYFLFWNGDAYRRARIGDEVLPGYLGYSRFMLYFLPPMMALAWQALQAVIARCGRWVFPVGAVWLAANLCMSPLRADGSRVVGWGDYIIDTQEHIYPHRELYAWLAEQSPQPASVTFIGRRYGYDAGDRLYARRFGLQLETRTQRLVASVRQQVGEPLGPPELLREEFEQAARSAPDVVVVHEPVYGPRWSDVPAFGRYRLAATFSFGGLRLIAYTRATGTAMPAPVGQPTRRIAGR